MVLEMETIIPENKMETPMEIVTQVKPMVMQMEIQILENKMET